MTHISRKSAGRSTDYKPNAWLEACADALLGPRQFPNDIDRIFGGAGVAVRKSLRRIVKNRSPVAFAKPKVVNKRQSRKASRHSKGRAAMPD